MKLRRGEVVIENEWLPYLWILQFNAIVLVKVIYHRGLPAIPVKGISGWVPLNHFGKILFEQAFLLANHPPVLVQPFRRLAFFPHFCKRYSKNGYRVHVHVRIMN